ncbi:bifunctional protein-disulfide isomerase/oxidoreductase DsbC [Shewanella sp. JM162201]|uniref:Thiol:disulfide interchange protein n=1 Tax=Shewanella jiangmenensis TaxID=2837387 RepID=A0ABS5V169_9GAMM|nr:bifunctional protein-disulfide isomerase/oxidoreductase DsbC [Shewanella jiangmenensis]MBT1443552.1 bifunctional protein-disulfide isomerase/oxidoreductase DsbC [Shewanella jiangmenensis]
MKLSRSLTLWATLMLSPVVFASSPTPNDMLKQKIQDTLGLEVSSITAAPIDGLFQVITNRGVLYVTPDGSKLVHGNIYDLNDAMNNLTELALAGPRLEMLKGFEDKMLVYKAKDEKHVVTVFTDITCGYCRKLHREMADYNKLGITVRYLAFPRQGVPSPNADEMEAVWCAKDPRKAMDDAKAGKAITAAKCDADIAGQYNLGGSFGINGTPAIILEDGSLIPGYQPANELFEVLERRGKH